jgi:hypothetical protein
MFEQIDEAVNKISSSQITKEILATLPTTVTDDQKKEITPKLEQIIERKVCDLKVARTDVECEVKDKIEKLAQTTKDLEKVPFFGGIGLFLRGMQRPIWGFSLLYIDLKVLSGGWTLPANSQTESAFWLLNLLILGFLFGERAVRNVMPMINKRIGKTEP